MRAGVSLRIKSVRLDGFDPDFRVSRLVLLNREVANQKCVDSEVIVS